MRKHIDRDYLRIQKYERLPEPSGTKKLSKFHGKSVEGLARLDENNKHGSIDSILKYQDDQACKNDFDKYEEEKQPEKSQFSN